MSSISQFGKLLSLSLVLLLRCSTEAFQSTPGNGNPLFIQTNSEYVTARRSNTFISSTTQGTLSMASTKSGLKNKKRRKFQNFDQMLQAMGDQPILIDFQASWCGPCKIVQQELEHVRHKIGDRLHVFNVDTDRFPSLGLRFQIAALPTILLFKDGEVIHRITGVESADEIMEQVSTYL
jgi:thioredoxin